MTMQAQPIDAVTVLEAQCLPDGVRVLLVPCNQVDDMRQLPKAVLFEGRRYGKTGWNSDSLVAYYRDDARFAVPHKGVPR